MKYEIDLSDKEIELLETALRLREEASHENNEHTMAKRWADLRKKLIGLNSKEK